MPGWRAHRKECWFVAVRDILCEFLADSLTLLILEWANRFGLVKVSPRTKTTNVFKQLKNEEASYLAGTIA